MLCVTDASTGFNWVSGRWVQTNFFNKQYVVSKVPPESSFGASRCGASIANRQTEPIFAEDVTLAYAWGCYDIPEVGDEPGIAIAEPCQEQWQRSIDGSVTLSALWCTESGFSRFQLRTNGPFVLTRTYAAFAANNESRDSLVLQVGRCSLL